MGSGWDPFLACRSLRRGWGLLAVVAGLTATVTVGVVLGRIVPRAGWTHGEARLVSARTATFAFPDPGHETFRFRVPDLAPGVAVGQTVHVAYPEGQPQEALRRTAFDPGPWVWFAGFAVLLAVSCLAFWWRLHASIVLARDPHQQWRPATIRVTRGRAPVMDREVPTIDVWLEPPPPPSAVGALQRAPDFRFPSTMSLDHWWKYESDRVYPAMAVGPRGRGKVLAVMVDGILLPASGAAQAPR